MAEVITPEMFAPKASPKMKDSGFSDRAITWHRRGLPTSGAG